VHRNLDAQNSHSQPGTAEFALTNARKNSLLVSNEVESTAVSNAKKVDPWGGTYAHWFKLHVAIVMRCPIFGMR
jgi:hypothetical protein